MDKIPLRHSFHLRLLSLVLFALAPAAGLVIYTNLQLRQAGVATVKETALLTAHLAAAKQEGTVKSVTQLLVTLSQTPLFLGQDQKTYNSHFANLLKLHPEYTDYGLIETNGRLYASALPRLAIVDLSEEAYFQQARAIQTMGIGKSHSSEGDPASLYFAYPMLSAEGQVLRVIYAALNLLELERSIDQTSLPAGAQLNVLDRNGIVLAHYPRSTGQFGKPSVIADRLINLKAQEEVFEATDDQAIPRLYAVVPVLRENSTGLYVSVGIPRDIAFASANRLLAQNLVLLGIVTLAVFICARLYAGRTILQPINALMQTAERIAEGDLTARTGLPMGASQLSRFAQAFDRMAEVLQRRQVEIAQAEGKFRILVEQSIVGIYIIQQGKFTYVNPKLAEIVGYTQDELTGKEVLPFIAPEDRDIVSGNIQKRLKGVVNSLQYQLRMLHKDGTTPTVEVHGSRAVYNDQPAIIGTLLDISDRLVAEAEVMRLNRELEQRVIERTAQLEAANQELEAFSYSVSHDLRAPLRHVDGFADLLRKHTQTTLDDKGQRLLKTISDAAKRMGLLIDDLLTFSRMGRSELCHTKIDLNSLVREILRSLEQDTQNRQIEWQIHPLPLVEGDLAMLRQVYVNLLSNALKYSRTRETARIEVGSMTGQAGETIFYVRDNGVGFDMSYAHKLFGVFQRLHGTNQFEGTGIGLANVRRIIHRHGGKTWAEGKEDEGATFYFSLPTTLKG